MKTQIILLAALFTLSTKAFAAEDYTKRIRCSKEAAKAKVLEMVDAESEDFQTGMKAVGKKLRNQFVEMINFQEKTAKMSPSEVKDLIWKADCIMVVAMASADVPNDVNARYEKNLGVLQSHTEEALAKLPEDLTAEELNVFAANTIIQNNRGPVAFAMALFEPY